MAEALSFKSSTGIALTASTRILMKVSVAFRIAARNDLSCKALMAF